ncbi:MAG: sulfotransferase domain-containing protein [Acidimicrobiia bacterium]
MEQEFPEQTRIYRHHHLDSTRWDGVTFRPGDVVVSTSAKAGTTWMQRILSLLVLGAGDLPGLLSRISPWIDCRYMEPIDDTLKRIEAQEHQRFLKSHLPLDALPYDPGVRYICVGRDTRDVFMSLWNHYRSYTDAMYETLAKGDPVGGPLPRCPAEPRQLWLWWMTRGSFAWESDGWPFWSHHYQVASFWRFRHLPNVLLVHYNDLLADLAGEMRRVADFVGVDVPAARWPDLVEGAGFEAMKRGASALLGDMERFSGGATTFIYKGTNQRWRDVLEPGDLDLYERVAGTLDPGMGEWLENGRLGGPVAGRVRLGP